VLPSQFSWSSVALNGSGVPLASLSRQERTLPGKPIAVNHPSNARLRRGTRSPGSSIRFARPYARPPVAKMRSTKIPVQVPPAQTFRRPTWGAHRGSPVIAPGQHRRTPPSRGNRAHLEGVLPNVAQIFLDPAHRCPRCRKTPRSVNRLGRAPASRRGAWMALGSNSTFVLCLSAL
jgi:hypothetical protein